MRRDRGLEGTTDHEVLDRAFDEGHDARTGNPVLRPRTSVL